MESPPRRWAAYPICTVVLLGLLLLLSGNWILPLLDRDEPRFAEAAREMWQRGDWAIPRLNGAYRFDKPPLIYWCQVGVYRLLGESAFAARLPSVGFAIATALLLLLWGRRIGQPRAGFHAALMFLTCLQVLMHGRLAVADMPMVFFVTAACWSGWELTRPEASAPRWRWWWILALSLGFGFLAKGPVAWLPVVGLAIGRMRRPLAFRCGAAELAAAVALALAVVAVWGIPALLATQGEFLRVGIGRHVLQRSFGVLEGHGARGWVGWIVSLPLYGLTFFASFFPWAVWFPGALRDWWRERAADALGWYLLVQTAVVFAVFSVVRTKLPHYILPAFPCAALWLALTTRGHPRAERRIARGVAGMAALAFLVTLGLFPLAKTQFLAANLHERARGRLSSDLRLGTVSFDEPSLVWEFRKDLTHYMVSLPPEQAAAFLRDPAPCVLVLPSRQADALMAGVDTNVFRFDASGYDTARFKHWELTALVRPAGTHEPHSAPPGSR